MRVAVILNQRGKLLMGAVRTSVRPTRTACVRARAQALASLLASVRATQARVRLKGTSAIPAVLLGVRNSGVFLNYYSF